MYVGTDAILRITFSFSFSLALPKDGRRFGGGGLGGGVFGGGGVVGEDLSLPVVLLLMVSVFGANVFSNLLEISLKSPFFLATIELKNLEVPSARLSDSDLLSSRDLRPGWLPG